MESSRAHGGGHLQAGSWDPHLHVFIGALIPATGTAAVTITNYKIISDLPASGRPGRRAFDAPGRRVPRRGLVLHVRLSDPGRGHRDCPHQLRAGTARQPRVGPEVPRGRPAGAQLRRHLSRRQRDRHLAPARTRTRRLELLPGMVYNAEPLGNEPGRLGVVTPGRRSGPRSSPRSPSRSPRAGRATTA